MLTEDIFQSDSLADICSRRLASPNGLVVTLVPVHRAEPTFALLAQMLRIGKLRQLDSLLLCSLTGSFLRRGGLQCSRMSKLNE